METRSKLPDVTSDGIGQSAPNGGAAVAPPVEPSPAPPGGESPAPAPLPAAEVPRGFVNSPEQVRRGVLDESGRSHGQSDQDFWSGKSRPNQAPVQPAERTIDLRGGPDDPKLKAPNHRMWWS